MSKISIAKRVGKSEFTFWVDEEKFKDALAAAAFYASTPDKCSICNGEDVTLDSNRTQEGYLYIKVKCLNEKCRAQATLGEYKDGKGGFWKKFEKYEPKNGEESPVEKQAKAEEKKEEKSENPDEGYPF